MVFILHVNLIEKTYISGVRWRNAFDFNLSMVYMQLEMP